MVQEPTYRVITSVSTTISLARTTPSSLGSKCHPHWLNYPLTLHPYVSHLLSTLLSRALETAHRIHLLPALCHSFCFFVFACICNWLIHRIPPSKKQILGVLPLIQFHSHFCHRGVFISRSAFKDETKLLGRRLVIYFGAHGSRVPGNKMPFMFALCLIQGSNLCMHT